jgi:predicted molibdopterin-dependent oxidoreductase YjgC
VVIGDQEPADRAGTVELRIRKARRDGAHLAIVGPGGTSLESDAKSFIRTHPGAGSAMLAALTAAVIEAGGANVRTDAKAAGSVDALAQLAGAAIAQIRELAGTLVGAQRPVLLVTDPVAVAEIEALAWVLGLDRTEGGVVPLPVGANERGERAGVKARGEPEEEQETEEAVGFHGSPRVAPMACLHSSSAGGAAGAA